ncbi:MAG: hypothetical protein IPJ64_00260 [Saprospiraceae bacterium]|nr:hypothetical protein [Saprospiraceae bacterium]MBK7794802.1 hypothetical protein [Saprospiraceae bacterium]
MKFTVSLQNIDTNFDGCFQIIVHRVWNFQEE